MALTGIADQLTPARPIELGFDAETGLPSANQELLLIGHAGSGAATGTAANYVVTEITAVTDADDAKTEAELKFGVGSELAKMVVAAVKANAGGSTFPTIKAVKLANSDAGFGSSDVALTAAKRVKAEFLVSCYDGDGDTLSGKLKDAAVEMSGATRTDNNQFGTFGVTLNQSVADPSTLKVRDSYNLIAVWNRDSAPQLSVAEEAAACAARIAANPIPFNPMDDLVIAGMLAPAVTADRITTGGGMESETALTKGWTPIRTMPNGDRAFVRTVTTRRTVDGTTTAKAYLDVQDFQVLFFWRKTLWTRSRQTDFKNVKASEQTAKDFRSEMVRLAHVFQTETMFQRVDELAKQFVVQRSLSDRHRFDFKTPVNVVPGLHVIAGKILATTLFDEFSV